MKNDLINALPGKPKAGGHVHVVFAGIVPFIDLESESDFVPQSTGHSSVDGTKNMIDIDIVEAKDVNGMIATKAALSHLESHQPASTEPSCKVVVQTCHGNDVAIGKDKSTATKYQTFDDILALSAPETAVIGNAKDCIATGLVICLEPGDCQTYLSDASGHDSIANVNDTGDGAILTEHTGTLKDQSSRLRL